MLKEKSFMPPCTQYSFFFSIPLLFHFQTAPFHHMTQEIEIAAKIGHFFPIFHLLYQDRMNACVFALETF